MPVANDINGAVFPVVDFPDTGQGSGLALIVAAVGNAVVLGGVGLVAVRLAVLAVGRKARAHIDHVDLFDLLLGQQIFLSDPVRPEKAAQGAAARVGDDRRAVGVVEGQALAHDELALAREALDCDLEAFGVGAV